MKRNPGQPQNKLGKEISVTLTVKVLFLFLLWFLFFQKPDTPLPVNQQVEQNVFGISAVPNPNVNTHRLPNKEP